MHRAQAKQERRAREDLDELAKPIQGAHGRYSRNVQGTHGSERNAELRRYFVLTWVLCGGSPDILGGARVYRCTKDAWMNSAKSTDWLPSRSKIAITRAASGFAAAASGAEKWRGRWGEKQVAQRSAGKHSEARSLCRSHTMSSWREERKERSGHCNAHTELWDGGKLLCAYTACKRVK
jgi:hypothetical protein